MKQSEYKHNISHILIMLSTIVALLLATIILPYADAAETSETSEKTVVTLQQNIPQISVSAPASMNIIAPTSKIDNGVISFTVPTSFEFENNSTVSMCLKRFTVSCYEKSFPVHYYEFEETNANNAYTLTVSSPEGNIIDVNSDCDELGSEWNFAPSSEGKSTVQMLLSGKIKNISSDFPATVNLQTITWIFSTELNA